MCARNMLPVSLSLSLTIDPVLCRGKMWSIGRCILRCTLALHESPMVSRVCCREEEVRGVHTSCECFIQHAIPLHVCGTAHIIPSKWTSIRPFLNNFRVADISSSVEEHATP